MKTKTIRRHRLPPLSVGSALPIEHADVRGIVRNAPWAILVLTLQLFGRLLKCALIVRRKRYLCRAWVIYHVRISGLWRNLRLAARREAT